MVLKFQSIVSPTVLNTPHGTHDIFHVHHDIPHCTEHPMVLKKTPTVLMISPTILNTSTVLKISPTFIMISPIPPWYSRYPTTVLMISPHGTDYPHSTEFPYGTAHTLYRVLIFKIGQKWLWRLKLHAYFSSFRNGFRKLLWQACVELHRQA